MSRGVDYTHQRTGTASPQLTGVRRGCRAGTGQQRTRRYMYTSPSTSVFLLLRQTTSQQKGSHSVRTAKPFASSSSSSSSNRTLSSTLLAANLSRPRIKVCTTNRVKYLRLGLLDLFHFSSVPVPLRHPPQHLPVHRPTWAGVHVLKASRQGETATRIDKLPDKARRQQG